jgi:lipase ATG15
VQSHSITSPPGMPSHTSTPSPPSHKSHCVRRSWLGFCKEWSMASEWREEI